MKSSRTLRRPMFRMGGSAEGITSGLDKPKRGLVDEPGGYAGEEEGEEDSEEDLPSMHTTRTGGTTTSRGQHSGGRGRTREASSGTGEKSENRSRSYGGRSRISRIHSNRKSNAAGGWVGGWER